MAITLDGTNGVTASSPATVKTNAILDASGGNTATINGVTLRTGTLDPENRIINGAFDFWQRGTSFSGYGYSADRWINSSAGGSTAISQQAFALGDTLGSNNPKYFLRQTVSGQTGSNEANIVQRIEDARAYAGQTITVLGWARRSSGAGNMKLFLYRVYGTGGSPSANEAAGNVNPDVTLSTSWQPFAATITVSSIAGKTIGTNGDSNLSLGFSTSGGNLGSIQTIGVDLWGIHIKLGTHTTVATDLYKQPEQVTELIRCQRYYEKSYDINTAPGAATLTGGVSSGSSAASPTTGYLGTSIAFKVVKRSNPNVTYYDGAGASGKCRRFTYGLSNNDGQVVATNVAGVAGVDAVFSSGTTSNTGIGFQYVADAEL